MTHVLDALGRIKEYWGSVALADLDDYVRGRIIRGGAVDWEAYAAETLGAVLIGDGTDIISDTSPTFVGLVTFNAGLNVAAGQAIVMGDGATIGQVAGPLITFDDTLNYLEITGCNVGIMTATPLKEAWMEIDGNAADDGTHGLMLGMVRPGHSSSHSHVLFFQHGWSAAGAVINTYDTFGVKATGGDSSGALLVIGSKVSSAKDADFDNFTNHLIIDNNGHVYPGSNKAQDFGLAGSRWREIFCSLALNTGTSRLVPIQKNCAVDGTQLVRSTGGLRVTGEESDFLLAFCPLCGTVAMEELKHRIAPAVKSAPEIVFTGMEVLKSSGNTKSVVVNFRYGDDVEDEFGEAQKAPHNSTTLSDNELAAFLKMTDEERKAFLLSLGQIEWNALEKMEVIGPELDDEQVQIDALIQELIGKDLLKGVASGKPN